MSTSECPTDYLTTGTGGRVQGWYYHPDGKMVPSVTEVLGLLTPDLTGWAAGIASRAVYQSAQTDGLYCRSTKLGITQSDAERTGRDAVEGKRAAAADIGTELHASAWGLLGDGHPLPTSRPVGIALDNLRRWYSDTGPERVRVVATEQQVYGDGYAGTLDGVVMIDGQAGVLELKTSRELRPAHAMQAAAYRAAWTREGKSPRLSFAAVLRVDKTRGGYEMAMVDQRRALAAFKAVLRAYFAVRGRVYAGTW